MAKKRFKIIPETVVENLIAFLDEIQFDAAKDKDSESINKINFCSWAIEQLINSYDGFLKDDETSKKKSRDEMVDEQFHDWKMPEMDDDEFKKLVENFDSFLKGWEDEYYKKNPKKKPKPKQQKKTKNFKPRIDDVIEYCSLEEIEEMLMDDPELSDVERFELYYDERERRRIIEERKKERKNSVSYEQMLNQLGIGKPGGKNEENNK